MTGFHITLWTAPQWLLAAWLFLILAVSASKHGQPKVDRGDEPYRWNFWAALVRIAMLVLLLTAGGFFK